MMLSLAYYANNYAGIINAGLLTRLVDQIKYMEEYSKRQLTLYLPS